MIARFAHHAMATRWEFVLCSERDELSLRAVADEAFEEIDRLEAQLSAFRDDNELCDLNRNAARAPVRVDPRFFRLVQRAREWSEQTDGAFDITVAPLLRLWGLRGAPPLSPPDDDAIAATREVVGSQRLLLDEVNSTIAFPRDGMELDLGGLGKGYALDRAAALIREAGIESALLQAGTSSVVALGAPPDADAWKVAIGNTSTNSPARQFAIAHLMNNALSVSAQHGRGVVIAGKTYGHTVDPRTGYPVETALLAAVVCESATEAEALSTALLTAGVTSASQQEATSWLRHSPDGIATGGDAIVVPATRDPKIEDERRCL